MRNDSPATRVLKLAKRTIEVSGWIQGNYGNRSCGYCSIGAIAQASVDSLDGTSIAHAATDIFAGAIPLKADSKHASRSIITWNDRKTRKLDEVLAAFDRAIELSRSIT